MQTGRTPLTIGCFVFAIVACALGVARSQLGKADPPAKYVLTLGQPGRPIDLKNRPAFISTLKSASWRRDLVFQPAESNLPPNLTGLTQANSTVHIRAITQDRIANPNNQQVTQRVGLRADQKPLMDALLDQVKE